MLTPEPTDCYLRLQIAIEFERSIVRHQLEARLADLDPAERAVHLCLLSTTGALVRDCREADTVRATSTIFSLMTDDRPKYWGVVGDLSQGDWTAAQGFNGIHSLRWDIPARIRLLPLDAGPWSVSLGGNKTYIAVLKGSISVDGKIV